MKNKEALIEQLKTTPIIQVACQKANVGRASYYRWLKEDEDFKKKADEALNDGTFFINDLSESKLISAIKDGNMTAIIYWIKHHHPAYTENKVFLSLETQEELIKFIKAGDKDKIYKKLLGETAKGNISPNNTKGFVSAVTKTPPTALSISHEFKEIQNGVLKTIR